MKMLRPTTVVEPRSCRRRGRPRLTPEGQAPEPVYLLLPPDEYHALDRIAKTRRVSSIQQLIRQALKRFIEDERSVTLNK